MTRRSTLVTAAAGLLVLVLCGAALADNYTYRRTAADDARAASVALRSGDFPVQLQLKGGAIKPDETPDDESCNGYRPKESDLVVSGDAETRFQNANGSVAVDSQIELLKTSAMAATDVKRSKRMLSVSCQLQAAKQEHVKLVSYVPMGPARCGCAFSASYVFETKTAKAGLDHLVIVTVMRKARAEATVLTLVGKSTSDKQGTALRDALAVQGLAVKAVAARLPAK
jgi:hypothetical protein